MFVRAITSVGVFGQMTQCNSSILTTLARQTGVVLTQSRYMSKHHDPKFKKLRAQKVIKIKLPDMTVKDEDLTSEQVRSRMKEEGLLPSKPWIEKQIFIGASGIIFDPYVPPEGDGKFSTMSTTGVKQKVDFMTKKGKSYLAVRKIKSYDEDFEINQFKDEAQEIYIKAHEATMSKDEDALRLTVTEKAYPEVTHNTADKTIRWKFIQSLDPPKVVHARTDHLITKENIFAQITVRFHTQQILAVYDRFGRLMHGSENTIKDVLEYVVFEKHMSNQYGLWRIHAKIIPEWMPPREYSARTFIEESPKQSDKVEPTSGTSVSSAPEIKNDSKTDVTAPP